jgi:hypothetical protein
MRQLVPAIAILVILVIAFQFLNSKSNEAPAPMPAAESAPTSDAVLPDDSAVADPPAGGAQAATVIEGSRAAGGIDWNDARFRNADGSFNLAAIADEKIRLGELTTYERADYIEFLAMAEQTKRNETEEVLDMGGGQ